MRHLVLAAALVCATLAPTPAAAKAPPAAPAPTRSDGELTGWLILGEGIGYGSGYQFGFGVGGRYRFSLVPEGLIQHPRVRDTVDLEFGGDLVRYAYGYNSTFYNYDYTWWALRPRVGAMWNFWLTPRFALYPKLDLGYEFGWMSGWNSAAGPSPTYSGFFVEPSVGLIYQLRNGADLRAELGSEGLKLGLGFTF
jgi:hypothetical protein